MQINPPLIPECGPGLEFMLESFPLAQVLPMIFRGAGDCTVIEWTFLGLSIANWSLVSFTATVLFAGWMLLRRG
jgi:disulfide bond formation protein DsbB